jgi:hypothetical protein
LLGATVAEHCATNFTALGRAPQVKENRAADIFALIGAMKISILFLKWLSMR